MSVQRPRCPAHPTQSIVDSESRNTGASFLRTLLARCDQHLEHSEPRVRSLVAGTLGALTRAGDDIRGGSKHGEPHDVNGSGAEDCTGLAVYIFFRERLLGAIGKNFSRAEETITDVITGANNVAVDDTSGWKALETSLLALKVCCCIALRFDSHNMPSFDFDILELLVVFVFLLNERRLQRKKRFYITHYMISRNLRATSRLPSARVY